jgi:hypothetical protein
LFDVGLVGVLGVQFDIGFVDDEGLWLPLMKLVAVEHLAIQYLESGER